MIDYLSQSTLSGGARNSRAFISLSRQLSDDMSPVIGTCAIVAAGGSFGLHNSSRAMTNRPTDVSAFCVPLQLSSTNEVVRVSCHVTGKQLFFTSHHIVANVRWFENRITIIFYCLCSYKRYYRLI